MQLRNNSHHLSAAFSITIVGLSNKEGENVTNRLN